MGVVAVLGMGEMGAAVARAVRDGGAPVITTLAGRTQASRERAKAGGIEVLPSLADVVAAADLILSIVPPAVAADVANSVADVLATSPKPVIFADCNAVSPATLEQERDALTRQGATFVDLAIMGPPPAGGKVPYMPASGASVDEVQSLTNNILNIHDLGGEAGKASALKMCYAALTKGGTALHVELLAAAQRLGVRGELETYLGQVATNQLQIMNKAIPSMAPKAARWVAEMDEIAATFADVGLTPLMLRGAGDMYRLVSSRYCDPKPAADVNAMIELLGPGDAAAGTA